MAYIYKITNTLNGKMYIGKTTRTIAQRFREHCNDAMRLRCEKRPLYTAMRKYGTDVFKIELIEECSVKNADSREQFWIQYYNTFSYGYNATVGGDGKPYIDYKLIFSLWREGKTGCQIAKIMNCTTDTVKAALDEYKVSHEERTERARKNLQHGVIMVDKVTHEDIRAFSSIGEACNFLGVAHNGHIAQVCTGKRKTAYGYSWRYI